MKIGVIGTGTIATAVIHGIADDDHHIFISSRNAQNAKVLSDAYDNVLICENQDIIDKSDVIFLGLMPDVATNILPDLSFRQGQTVISFIADLSLEAVGALVMPAKAVAMMLPYPNIANGNSVIPMMGDKTLIEEIFGQNNALTVLNSQQEINALLCAQAVLSPVAKMVDDTANWLAEKGVDKARGEPFLRLLVASNLQELPAAELLNSLNTEGGYNQRLRQHMDAADMPQALYEGLDKLSE